MGKILTLKDYYKPINVPAKLLSGRDVIDAPMHSPLIREWYDEQYEYVINGITINGKYWNPLIYHFLNFFYFPVQRKNPKTGRLYVTNEPNFALFSRVDEYIFDKMWEAMNTDRHIMIMGSRGIGKAQSVSTEMIINGQLKRLFNAKVGDLVHSDNGKETEITHITEYDDLEMYEIEFADGRITNCSTGHLWNVYKQGDKKTRTVEAITLAENLRDGTSSKTGGWYYSVPISGEVEYKEKEQSIDPYIVGCLLSSGLYCEGHDIRVATKCIPENYMYGSIEQRYALVQGLMDSDGHAYKNGYNQEYYSVSEGLIDDLAYVLRSLGIKCTKGDDIRKDGRKGFLLYILTGKPIFRLPRKLNLVKLDSEVSSRILTGRYKTAIVRMELHKGKEKGRCITVADKSGTYLTNDFIVTHNSYWATSILLRKYNFFQGTHSVVSASIQEHVDTAWNNIELTLNFFDKKHPALKHKRRLNNNTEKQSGEVLKTDTGDVLRGFNSRIEKILYGRNPNKTRSKRPDAQLIEEFGAFPSKGLGNLKDVLAQSRGSNKVGGGIMKNFVMMLGTGGSVSNDHAKEVFHKPDAYDFLSINEWDGMNTGIFIPVQIKRAGTWEDDGVPDIKKALEQEAKERDKLKAAGDPVSYNNYCQEYPQNIREVFLKKGTNRFNQNKIAAQAIILENPNSSIPKVKRGSFKYIKNDLEQVMGVTFVHDSVGPINMIEEVELTADKKRYDDLYVMGVDSIDMGTGDSADENKGSKLAALVKKRIINGKSRAGNSSMYVCWYNERSFEVRDDYEQVLMMAMYYKSKINLEYTRINIISYFREKGFFYMFMKRPSIALGGDGTKRSNLVGTQVNDTLIDHQDSKISDYINDYSERIFSIVLLEQLRDYQREDRTPYDLVVAMGLCELADEEYIGVGAKAENDYASTKMKKFGYYTDKNGYKRKGELPTQKDLSSNSNYGGGVTWIDASGEAKYESEYLDSLKFSEVLDEVF